MFGTGQVRIEVRRLDLTPKITYTDIFHDADQIPCTGLGIGAFPLHFCAILPSEVGVIDRQDKGGVMNADQASE